MQEGWTTIYGKKIAAKQITTGRDKPVGATDVHDEGHGFEGVIALDSANALGVRAVLGKVGQSNKIVVDQSWAVVNRSQSKINSTSRKNQILAAKNIEVSNSFYALVNEHDGASKKTCKDLQHVDDEERSVARKTSSTVCEKQ